ncbi:M23 family metallopeptidase [Alteromonas sp. 1_MG-2023]|uniref:M23 family metallopeptidase n=1 Tax=Alteromonas sp. 1_MG-2023 TaxID=3062669 RepID=UPI0026E2458E|nr:M23 family metallopeptidase [Alteromonas sp. 1_MG-2023]MDO6568839.1 M23 family metallopeptidase [Alteromonas sp. 1_MG-2023]
MIKWISLALFTILLLGFIIPEPRLIPVENASSADWNKETFWYEPWGTSGVHKGIDIFAQKGTSVIASTNQVILYQGQKPKGGNIVLALGPKWRLHYYAHLESIDINGLSLLSSGSKIGTVGSTGNAKGKAPHLHYSIVSIIPYFWLADESTQGSKKAYYLNPIIYLTSDTP